MKRKMFPQMVKNDKGGIDLIIERENAKPRIIRIDTGNAQDSIIFWNTLEAMADCVRKEIIK